MTTGSHPSTGSLLTNKSTGIPKPPQTTQQLPTLKSPDTNRSSHSPINNTKKPFLIDRKAQLSSADPYKQPLLTIPSSKTIRDKIAERKIDEKALKIVAN